MTVDEVITRYKLDNQYSRGAKQIKQDAGQVAQALDNSMKKSGTGGTGSWTALSSVLGSVSASAGGAARTVGMLGQAAAGASSGGLAMLVGVLALIALPIWALSAAIGAVLNILGKLVETILGAVSSALGFLGSLVERTTSALFSMAAALYETAAKFDSLQRGMVATMGTAAAAAAEIERLKEVAKLPGLGFAEAIEGSINLQQVGMSAGLARRVMMEFGNAIATVGKGKAEFQMVLYALTQIMTAGKLLGQDLRQLQNYLPSIRRLLREAFGTDNTEALGKMGITADMFLEKMLSLMELEPRMTGGLGNALENLSDAWDRFKATVGAALGEVIMPLLNGLANALAAIEKSNAIKGLLNQFVSFFSGDLEAKATSFFISLASKAIAFLELLPRVRLALYDTFARAFTGIQWIMDAFFTYMLQKFRALRAELADLVAQALTNGLWDPNSRATYNELADQAQKNIAVAKRQAGRLVAGGGLSALGQDISNRADEIAAGMQKALGGSGSPEQEKATSVQNTLADIADATKETARNTKEQVKLSKYAFGQGDVGRMGVTPVEMHKMRRSIQIEAGHGSALEKAIQEIARAVMIQAGFQGGAF